MPFDWATYLDLARELAGQRSGSALHEARLRSAVSRAYYAAFKTAFNFLCGVDPATRFQRDGVHQYVYEKFQYHPDVHWREIGSLLDRLRRLRNRADYDDQIADLPADTEKALQHASDLLAALSKLP